MAYTVAIADDEVMMLRGLTRIIPWGELGYEVVAAVESGRELIDFVSARPVDVVLTDVSMDDMSGIDVARYLHEHAPETITVIISGYLDFAYAQQAIEHGVYKYLLKPVSVEEMRALMNELSTEIARRRRASRMESQYATMRPRLLRRFAADAARGSLRNPRALEQRLREVALGESFLASRCMMCSFIAPLQGGEGDAAEQFDRTFAQLDVPAHCHTIYAEADWVRALLVEKEPGSLPEEGEQERFTQELARRFYHKIGKGVWIYVERRYDSVRALCREGFEKWNMPVLASALNGREDSAGSYNNIVTRHGIIKALREGDLEEMRVNLQDYMEECADPMHGIWHARFMARVLLWQIAQTIDEGGETLVFAVDEYAIVRAGSARQLTELVMSTTRQMLRQHEDDQRLQDPVEHAKQYIAEHYAQDLSLIDLSNHVLHISPAYFSRVFHERTGTTYIDYLNSVRLNAAAQLLRDSQEPLFKVAEKVGFADTKYFARRFKARFNCAPSEYRDREGRK